MENVTESSNSDGSHQAITWVNILTGIVLYTIVVVTIFGNLLVLVAVGINKNLQTTFNYYVVNLAITDLGVAVTAMSFLTTDNMLGYWPFGGFLCGVWIFFDYGMTFVSVFTLILISVDRFWSVTWSLHYRRHHSKKKSIIAIVFIWVFMLVLWLPPCIYDRIHHAMPGECIWEPSLNTGFVVVIAIIGHHGSCIAMLFCFLKVLMFMYKRRRIMAAEKGSSDPAVATDTASGCGKTTMLNSSVFLTSDSKVSSLEPNDTTPQEDQANITTRRDTLEVPTSHTGGNNTKTLPTHAPNSENFRRQKRDRAIFITLTYVIIGYAVCWIPFHVVFDVSSICTSCVSRGVYDLAFWMAYINSTINPFLYNFSTPEFRRTFKRILCRRKGDPPDLDY